jgi:acyl dehydratase
VTGERIVEFAAAIGDDVLGDGDVAPLTFAFVVAFGAMNELLTDPQAGIELHNVIHGDQRFEQSRPIRPGDVLTAVLTVDTLREAAGMDMVGTRTEITTVRGEHVATARATLVHRGGGA